MADQSTPGSRLLSLPGEIQNHIYRLAVVQDARILLEFRRQIHRRPGLMLTCRELHQVVGSIYFGENTFEFDSGRYASNRKNLSELERQAGSLAKEIKHVIHWDLWSDFMWEHVYPEDRTLDRRCELERRSKCSVSLEGMLEMLEAHANSSCDCHIAKIHAQISTLSGERDRNPLFVLFDVLARKLIEEELFPAFVEEVYPEFASI